MRDTKAMTEYIKTFGFYEDFMTYTQLKNAELAAEVGEFDETNEDEGEGEKNPVGRPMIDDGDIENENTAAGRDQGTNTSDTRE